MTTEDRIKELEAEIARLSNRICSMAADLAWADGLAYSQDKAQITAAEKAQFAAYQELRSLTVHTAVIPWYIIADRARESQQAASKERIAKALNQMNAHFGYTIKEVV